MNNKTFMEWQSFLATICSQHYIVLHNHIVDATLPVSRENIRRSFFRMNDNNELLAAEGTALHYPCVVHDHYSGGLIDTSLAGYNVSNGVHTTLLFLAKPTNNDIGNTNADAVEDAQELAFEVMMDFIAKFWELYSETGCCGPFNKLELQNFRWQPLGAEYQNVHGWRLNILFEVDTELTTANKWVTAPPPFDFSNDYTFDYTAAL
jgi:hypothetical protein